jgi:hypothetical protein
MPNFPISVPEWECSSRVRLREKIKDTGSMLNDTSVLDLLKKHNSLLDSRLIGIQVGREPSGAVNVELHFRARPDSDFTEIRIKFTSVIEYEVSYEESQEYVDIWDLKFLKLDDGSFYITLDPDPSTLPAAGATVLEQSDTDNLFVRARHMEAFLTHSGAEKEQ